VLAGEASPAAEALERLVREMYLGIERRDLDIDAYVRS
jgi:hypothetical protein